MAALKFREYVKEKQKKSAYADLLVYYNSIVYLFNRFMNAFKNLVH